MRPADICARYDFSIVIQRWAAIWVDILFRGVIIGIAFMVSVEGNLGLTIGLCAAFFVLYYPLLEGAIGQTPGKFVCGLKVVDADGNVPGFPKAIVRSLFRLFEINFFLFGGIPAAIAVYASKTRQRIGDRVADTYVVRTRDLSLLYSGGAIGYRQDFTPISAYAQSPGFPPPRYTGPNSNQNFGYIPASVTEATAAADRQAADRLAQDQFTREPSAQQSGFAQVPGSNIADSQSSLYDLPSAMPDVPREVPAVQSVSEPAEAEPDVYAPYARVGRKSLAGSMAYYTWAVLLLFPAIAMIAGARQSQLASGANAQPKTITCEEMLNDHSLAGWYHVTGCPVNLANSQGMYYYYKSSTETSTPAIDHNEAPYVLYTPIYPTEKEKQASFVIKSKRIADRDLFQEIDKAGTLDKKATQKWVQDNLARIMYTADYTGMVSEGSSTELSTDNGVKAFNTTSDYRILELDAEPIRGVGSAAGYGFGVVMLSGIVGLIAVGIRRARSN